MYKYNFKVHFRHFGSYKYYSSILYVFFLFRSMSDAKIKVWQNMNKKTRETCIYLSRFLLLIGSRRNANLAIYIINHINLIALLPIAVLNMQLSPCRSLLLFLLLLLSFMSHLTFAALHFGLYSLSLSAHTAYKEYKSFGSAEERNLYFLDFIFFVFFSFVACSGLRQQRLSLHLASASAATVTATSASLN